MIDIAHARKMLTALALELPEAVHRDVAKTFHEALDELALHRESASKSDGLSTGEVKQALLRAVMTSTNASGRGGDAQSYANAYSSLVQSDLAERMFNRPPMGLDAIMRGPHS